MRKIKVILFATLFSLAVLPHGTAHAFGQTRGSIVSLRIDPSTNRIFVKLGSATGGTPPACATGTEYTGVFLLTNSNSEALVNLLISARQDGALVNVRGADTCNAISNYEDISYISVQEG